MTGDARATTGCRWLLAVALGMSMAAGGSIVAGCGGDETPTGSRQAATENLAAETKSGAEAATDPTGNTYDASSQPRDARIKIAMKDSAFKPQYITARLGQTLVFTNDDAVAHKIKGQEGQYYSSETLGHGQTYEYRIKRDPELQNMAFICTIHSETMRGGVVVTK
jgi:plastocyanin